MCRSVFLLLLLTVSLAMCTTADAQTVNNVLIPERVAEHYGLERAWFTQLGLTPGGGGLVDVQLYVSSTKAQTIFRVVTDRGATYMFSDRNLDVFGDPLGVDGAGKAAAERVRLLRLEGTEAQIERSVVPDITLYATTASGRVHAIDAETGRQLWSTAVGVVRYPTTPAGISEDYVAVVNGQTLYVLDVTDGSILQERRVPGAAGAAPTIADASIFIPMLNGHVVAYAFGPESVEWPLQYRSRSSAEIQPTAAGNYVIWPNSDGDISVLQTGRHGIRYRIRTNEPIAGQIIYVAPQQILGATKTGNLYSFDLETGDMLWRYITGDATAQPAAFVGDMVFLTTRDQGMHVISATTGERLWSSVFQAARGFVAATKNYVYCTTDRGEVVVMDIATGRLVGTIPVNYSDHFFVNKQTDRIYISSSEGALQCFRERGADLPTLHQSDAEVPPEKPPAENGETPPDAAGAPAPATQADDEPIDPFKG